MSDDTKAILLLCGVFGDKSVKPLSPGEYNTVARWLVGEKKRPLNLLIQEVAEDAAQGSGIDRARLKALLGRGVALGFAVEQWERGGIWIVSRGDADYPARYKKHLKEKAPPLLFGAGDRALLEGGGLTIVGSRNVDAQGEEFTRTVAELCARQRIAVVSGGARGVDSIAMESALQSGGTVLAVLADSLLKKSLQKTSRSALAAGRLLLLSPFPPEAPFSVGAAMGRNKLIYALSDYALVISAEHKKGGTWAGAEEELKRENSLSVFVRMEGDVPEGNKRLLSLGAKPWPNAGSEDALRDLLGKVSSPSRPAPNYETKSLFEDTGEQESVAKTPRPTEEVEEKSTAGKPDFAEESISASAPRGVTESGREEVMAEPVPPAEALYLAVLPLLLQEMREPLSSEKLAALFNVSVPQIKKWLDRGVEERKLQKKKVGRGMRYCVNEPDASGCGAEG
jgi:predicted Rossmann fold nucleotide-binding protein DprA/Smf involved in DNA uptake